MRSPLVAASQSVTRAVRTLAATRRPAGYHGDYQGDAQFFEGWYVKLVSADRGARLALIPGIFRGGTAEADEAFVQVLDGVTGQSWFEVFPTSEFHADARVFDVAVGGNRFGARGLSVDLPGPRLSGDVRFGPLDPWPVGWRSPGVMGHYGWVPVMECYHGLVSFDHELSGSLTLAGRELDFDGGRGYLEKDWGRSFPSAYVWMQSNSFDLPGVSLSASIAIIPWGRSRFRGFIVGLRLPGEDGGVLHRFATYTGSRTASLGVDDAEVRWTMRSRAGEVLSLRARRGRGGLLHAPARVQAHRRVEETLDARIDVHLTDPEGRVLFEGVGEAAGLEVHGDLESLIALDDR